MTNSTSTLYVFLALFIGVILGFLIGRGRKANTEVADATLGGIQAQLATVQAQLNESRAQLEQERNRNQENVRLAQQITDMQQRVLELQEQAKNANQERIKAETAIHEQVSAMNRHNSDLVNQTRAIASAMSSSQSRGKFGEAQLEKLLQNAGLLEGEHFQRQKGAEKIGESGAIPDITIGMPGGSVIYIDSKFPFEKFYQAHEAQDEATRDALLKQHSADLKKHIKDLAAKGYPKRGLSPDFVVVFAPIESIFTEALRADPTLLDESFKLGVTIATPTTMMALLRTVGFVFSRNSIAQNAHEIQRIAGKFLGDLNSLFDKISKVGSALKSTVKAYNSLVPTAETTVRSTANKIVNYQIQGEVPEQIDLIDEQVRPFKAMMDNDDESSASNADTDYPDIHAV